MNILITSAGRRVSLVKAFQKELKKYFHKGKVMSSDFNPNLSAACQISDKSFQLPLVGDKAYINELIKICIENDIKLIVPTIDTELLALSENFEVLSEEGIISVVSSANFISICRDKRKMSDFFIKHNINVAKEYSKDNYTLPIFIKPINGSRSIDTFIIKKKDELTDYHFNKEGLMFLEYLDHNEYEEFTCDLYYDKDGALKCVVPRKRIEVRDGEVSKGVTDKNELVPFINKNLNFIDGARGCLTAQFFKHKKSGKVYGIEINARFGGGFPLTYLAGANYVRWIIDEYLFNKKVADFNNWEDKLLMLRYDKEVLVKGFNE